MTKKHLTEAEEIRNQARADRKNETKRRKYWLKKLARDIEKVDPYSATFTRLKQLDEKLDPLKRHRNG